MFSKCRRNDLKTLVKNEDLDNLQWFVENGDVVSTMTDSSGMTILHLAVRYDKYDLVKYLSTSPKINIDAQDSSGTTPLVLALREKRMEAAKLLIDADARIDIANSKGQTPLTYVVQYGLLRSTDRVMSKFREKFLATTKKQTILMLYRSVSLASVLTLRSWIFLRETLRSRSSIRSSESRTLIIAAMFSTYFDNLRILLSEGPDLTERWHIFREELGRFIESDTYIHMPMGRRGIAPVHLLMLVRWNMLDDHLIAFFKKVLQKGDESALEIVLTKGVLEHVKQLTYEDLTAHLFANKNRKVVKALQGRKFDVNAQGECGFSALHFAVWANSRENARFLLSKGADVNIKDDFGMTTLFYVMSYGLFYILIANGADVQVMNDEGFFAFEYNKNFYLRMNCILGHIVLLEASGYSITQAIRDRIQSDKAYKSRYEKYHSYFEKMKSYVVCDGVTMFTIFIKLPRNVEKFMRNKRKTCKEVIARFPLWTTLLFNNVYYYDRMKSRTKKALELCKLKNMAIEIVAESIRLFEAGHLIIHRIVDFLTYTDLCAIFK